MDAVAELELQICALRRKQANARTREKYWQLHDEIVALDRQAREIAAREREGLAQ